VNSAETSIARTEEYNAVTNMPNEKENQQLVAQKHKFLYQIYGKAFFFINHTN